MERERLAFQDLIELASLEANQRAGRAAMPKSSKRSAFEKDKLNHAIDPIQNFEEKANWVWERIYCRSREELGNGIVVLLKDVLEIKKLENNKMICKLQKRFGLKTSLLGQARRSGKHNKIDLTSTL